MLIVWVVLLAIDVDTEIGLFVETAIELAADTMDVVVATFVRIGILFMITEEPDCAAWPEMMIGVPPIVDLTSENVCVFAPDELTVTGDRLRFVIGDTVRNCFTTKILPADVVVIEPMLFWLNACDVNILPAVIVVGIVSVTIFGTLCWTLSIFAFSSLVRLTANTFSKLVGTTFVGVFSVLMAVGVGVPVAVFATDTCASIVLISTVVVTGLFWLLAMPVVAFAFVVVWLIDDIIERNCCDAFAMFEVISFGCDSGDNCGKFDVKRAAGWRLVVFGDSHDLMITCTGIWTVGFVDFSVASCDLSPPLCDVFDWLSDLMIGDDDDDLRFQSSFNISSTSIIRSWFDMDEMGDEIDFCEFSCNNFKT